MAEPTGALDFEDLIVEVAYYLSIADYDSGGNPAVPINNHDIELCKRIVNKAIRVFINDAPPQGWRWTQPVGSVVLWPDVVVGAATVSGGSYDSALNRTLLTATTASFYETMELHDIVITVSGTFNIEQYVSPTTIYVTGNASGVTTRTFAISSNGNFTLPRTFGGEYTGKITYAAGTNRGIQPRWADESAIRTRREDTTASAGTPYEFAVRVMYASSGRRRWELMTWTKPSVLLTVEFPYILYFDKLVNLTDTPPTPFGHDETLRAVCLSVAEMDVNDLYDGPKTKYYRERCLPASVRVDELSITKTLGYFGDPTAKKNARPSQQDWRDGTYQRPTVTPNV